RHVLRPVGDELQCGRLHLWWEPLLHQRPAKFWRYFDAVCPNESLERQPLDPAQPPLRILGRTTSIDFFQRRDGATQTFPAPFDFIRRIPQRAQTSPTWSRRTPSLRRGIYGPMFEFWLPQYRSQGVQRSSPKRLMSSGPSLRGPTLRPWTSSRICSTMSGLARVVMSPVSM